MSKMIQLRHVPDELHRKLKARAALEGLTLSDFLLREVRGRRCTAEQRSCAPALVSHAGGFGLRYAEPAGVVLHAWRLH